jgi:hypothetical protein
MTWNCCIALHSVLVRVGGSEGLKHKCFICFILYDQRFLPALPSSGYMTTDCPAVIFVENAHPYDWPVSSWI